MLEKKKHKKKLLLLTGSLPPSIGISAIRINRIIKYLYADGWEIHVVSSDRSKIDYNKETVLSKVSVYKIYSDRKTNPKDTNNSSINNISNNSGIVDKSIKFIKSKLREIFRIFYMQFTIMKGYKVAEKVLKENDIDIVYCTVPYITLACVGAKLKKKYKNIKLVEEIRDIISGNEIMESQQQFLERCLIRKAEKKVLSKVDDFIFLTRHIKEYYCDKYKMNPSMSSGAVITNSYDPDDFNYDSSNEEYASTSDCMIFSHVGSFYGSRNPINLVQALGELIVDNPQYMDKVVFQFVGSISDEVIVKINELIEKYNLSRNIKIIGKVPYNIALKYLKSSNINILITHESGSGYAIPGKLFDYIAVGNPVLALTNDDLVKEIIEEEKIGFICSNTDILRIKSTLKEIMENASNSSKKTVKRSEKYSIKYTIKEMQKVFLR